MNAEERMVARAISRIRSAAIGGVHARHIVSSLEGVISLHPDVARKQLKDARSDPAFLCLKDQFLFRLFLSEQGL